MATELRPGLAIPADGAFAGLIVGAVYGAWAVQLNQDVAHRTLALAFLRFSGPTLAAIVAGMLVSFVLAVFLGACARGGARAAWWGSALALALVMLALPLAAFPFREAVFPMHWFTPRATTAGAAAFVFAAFQMLVASRIADAIRNGEPTGRLRALLRTLQRAGRPAALVAVGVLIPMRLAFASAVHPGGAAPSVLVVSIDTLRADRVGVLGARRDLTPGIDRLAREGVLFTAAESAAPWTLPSHVSLFTSQLPWEHRVQQLGMRVGPERSMLAERFLDAGYRTAAFTAGGYLDPWYGFAQGFQVFETYPSAAGIGTEPIVDAALHWIDGAATRPFFAFVHTYAVHVPYSHSELADPRDAGRFAGAFSFDDLERTRRRDLVLTPSERRYVSDLYDGGVAYVDRALRRLFDELDDRGVLDRTIVVVLSDHGEDLWDHVDARSPDHGHSLYEELTRVPLLIRAPGLVAAGRRIETPVSLLDVAPTLLDLAGLPPDASHTGMDLAASCRTGGEPPARPVLSESTDIGPDRFAGRLRDTKVIVAPRAGESDYVAAPALEVFDLARDPAERRPLAARADDLVTLVETRARRMVDDASATRTPVSGTVPDAVSERLRALGYVH